MLILSAERRHTPSRYMQMPEDSRPCVVMRPASLEEWIAWRHRQIEVEDRRAERYEERLSEAGLTNAQYEQAVALLTGALRRGALHKGAATDKSADEAEEDADVDEEARQTELDEAIRVMDAYQRTWMAIDAERLSDLEHSIALLELVIVRFERVGLQDGTPLPWDTEALKALGLTRRQVLMSLAGPGIEGLAALVEMATAAVQGLDPEQKKDSTAT